MTSQEGYDLDTRVDGLYAWIRLRLGVVVTAVWLPLTFDFHTESKFI